MPMSFLCNTFFSTEQMPSGFRQVIELLPLSQASNMIRAISAGLDPDPKGFVILFAYLIIFSLISMWFIYKKKNL
jgi:ABC-type polysaccharide/polyol phosphate export permease